MEGIILSEQTFNHLMSIANQVPNVGVDPFEPTEYAEVSNGDFLPVLNNSGFDIEDGTPVHITGRDDTTSVEDVLFTCEASGNVTEIDGVSLGEIPQNSVGYIRVTGFATLRGVTVDDAGHNYVTVTAAGGVQTAEAGPIKILGGQNGMTDMLVWVSPYVPTAGIVVGTLDAALTGQASVDVVVTENTGAFGDNLSGTVTVSNPLALTGGVNDNCIFHTSADGLTNTLINVECS